MAVCILIFVISVCHSISLPREGASPPFSYKSAPTSNNRIPETIWRRGVSSRCLVCSALPFLAVFCCRSPCLEYGRKRKTDSFPAQYIMETEGKSWNEDQKITNARDIATNGHFNSRESRNGCFPVQKLCVTIKETCGPGMSHITALNSD